MAVKTLPDELKIKSVEWRLIQPAQVNRSGYTGARQVMALGAGYWTATVELVPFNSDATAAAWRGFLASLEGQVHTFYLPVLDQAAGSYPGRYMTYTLSNGKKQMVVQTEGSAYRPLLRGTPVGSPETADPYCEVALADSAVSWISQPARFFDFPSFEVEEAF